MESRQNRIENGIVAGWMLLAFLCLVFICGGSSRGDVNSLIVLRPVAVLFLATGIAMLTKAHVRNFWQVFVIFSGFAVLAIIQLLPLPPALWGALPGREAYVEAARLTGTADAWRPISVMPSLTRNSLMAFTIPLTVAVLFALCPEKYRRWSIFAVILFALMNMIIALLQINAAPTSALFFYKITNAGIPVGLFANANHLAMFLAIMPAFLFYGVLHLSAMKPLAQVAIFILTWMLLLGIVLMTGSRGGFALFAISSALLVFSSKEKRLEHGMKKVVPFGINWRLFAIFPLLAISSILLMFGNQNTAFQDIVGAVKTGGVDELRWNLIAPVGQMVADFMPFGAGGGTFPYVFYRYETSDLLTVAYVNHAHNDVLELPFEYGILGVILAVVGAFFIARAAIRSYMAIAHEHRTVSLAAVIGIAILAIGSAFDYPLRTPSIAAVFALMCMTLYWNTDTENIAERR